MIVFKREVKDECLIFVFNMTPNFYGCYDIGVPYAGRYEEILNSDKDIYGGWNQYNGGELKSVPGWYQNQPNRLTIKLASFGACFFKYIDEVEKVAEEEKKQVKPNKKNKSSSKN